MTTRRGFIGLYQLNFALDRGHTVTAFNRGRRSTVYRGRVEAAVITQIG